MAAELVNEKKTITRIADRKRASRNTSVLVKAELIHINPRMVKVCRVGCGREGVLWLCLRMWAVRVKSASG